jgi:hypothetical protein
MPRMIGSLVLRSTVRLTLCALLVASCSVAAKSVPTAALSATDRLERSRSYQANAPNPDQDRDGRISFDEWLEKEWQFLVTYDTDGDERLSMPEYIAAFCVSTPGLEAAYATCKRSKEDDFGVRGSTPGFRITREVFSLLAKRSFSSNDTNGDGYLLPGGEPRPR